MAEELAPSITVSCIAAGPVGADHSMKEWADTFPVPRPADRDPFGGGATRRAV